MAGQRTARPWPECEMDVYHQLSRANARLDKMEESLKALAFRVAGMAALLAAGVSVAKDLVLPS